MAIAALPSGDPERAHARDHAAGCVRCAAALGEGERLLAILDAGAPVAPQAEALQRILAHLVARFRAGAREAWWYARALWAVLFGSAAGAALASSSRGALAVSDGIFHCAAIELAAALLPLLLVARSVRALRTAPEALAIAAATGALVGQAALHAICPHRDPLHLFAFHVGAVALAAALGLATRVTILRRPA